MNFQRMALSVLSVALLAVASSSNAIVTSTSTPGITAGFDASQATSAKLGGMKYSDQTNLVEFAPPFDGLSLKVMSLKDNPTTGMLTLSIPYTMTSTEQGEPSILVGTIEGNQVGSTGTFYIYINKSDLANAVKPALLRNAMGASTNDVGTLFSNIHSRLQNPNYTPVRHQ